MSTKPTVRDLPEGAQKLIANLRGEVKLERARRKGALDKLFALEDQVRALRAELEALRASEGK